MHRDYTGDWAAGEFVLHIRDTAKYFDPFALGNRPVSARKAVLIWMPWE